MTVRRQVIGRGTAPEGPVTSREQPCMAVSILVGEAPWMSFERSEGSGGAVLLRGWAPTSSLQITWPCLE